MEPSSTVTAKYELETTQIDAEDQIQKRVNTHIQSERNETMKRFDDDGTMINSVTRQMMLMIRKLFEEHNLKEEFNKRRDGPITTNLNSEIQQTRKDVDTK